MSFPRIADIAARREATGADQQPGYTTEELQRGDDQAWYIPLCGCAAVIPRQLPSLGSCFANVRCKRR